MRCKDKVKTYYTEIVPITELNKNLEIKTINIQRYTWKYQQCPTTTKIKTARCWRRWGICGFHASKRYPTLYVKSKGISTGGRNGKIKNPLIIPILFK